MKMELKEVVDTVKEVIKLAEQKMKEQGGTFEGWLWYLLMPPYFVVKNNEIWIEYYSLDLSVTWRIIVDKETHKIKKAEEVLD